LSSGFPKQWVFVSEKIADPVISIVMQHLNNSELDGIAIIKREKDLFRITEKKAIVVSLKET